MHTLKHIFALLRVLSILPGVRWQDEKFSKDLARWNYQYSLSGSKIFCFSMLMWTYPEFRNLFIYRNRFRRLYRSWVKFFYRPMNTLFLESQEIGGGLFIQHGFATVLAAQSVGENCWINQQVTVGYTGSGHPPIIGNDVMITCGAKVLGSINIGDGAVIGANAVVVKDVEPGAIMVGVPAKKLSHN